MVDPPLPSGTPPDGAQEFVLQEPLGSVLSRLAARLFDAALMLLAVLVGIPLPNGGRIAVLVAVPILYETIMVATAGRTAGKMIMGLHVVRRSDGGRPELAAGAGPRYSGGHPGGRPAGRRRGHGAMPPPNGR